MEGKVERVIIIAKGEVQGVGYRSVVFKIVKNHEISQEGHKIGYSKNER